MQRPRPIDWNLTPDEQAWMYFQEVQSQTYLHVDDRPSWPSDGVFSRSEAQRQMAGSFEGTAYSWRHSGRPKLLHTEGAVGLFRLRPCGADLGSVLGADAPRLFLGRYSIGDRLHPDKPLILGLAVKFPRRRRTAVDILMLLNELRIQEVRDAWQHPFSTTIEDPRLTEGLKPEVIGEVRLGTAGLNAVARGVGAGTEVQAHSMPLPAGITADRLTWVHSSRASGLLRSCGNSPFEGDQMSPDDVPLVGKMRGAPWARLYVGGPPPDPTTSAWAEIYLESRLHIGPVGDYWLHFKHPMGGNV